MKWIFCGLSLLLATGQTIAQTKVSGSAKINQSKTVFINGLYIRKIDQGKKLITALMQEKTIPGLSVAVATKNDIIWLQGFGVSDLENNTPVKINSKFRIGSVSKTLTALAIGKLLESGQISLSDSVRQYVPYFPQKKYPLTIGDLASHKGGIRDYNHVTGEYLSNESYSSVRQSVGIFKADSLLFEPGTQYKYSSYGYVLLSAVIEGATKTSFLNYMRDSIFAPLNLENTVPDQNSQIIENRVRFYDKSSTEIVNSRPVNNSNKWAGGGYLSTPYDLVRMSQSLLKNEFLKKSTTQRLWTPAVLTDGKKTNYGIGWRQDKDSKNRIYVHHGGIAIGGRAFLLIYPDEELAIAVTANLSTDFDQTFVQKLGELFFKLD